MRKPLSTACLVLVLLFTVSALAANNVVVVPLGGAVGSATVEDVVKGKTFSNSMEKGLTGTLKINPAPTGDAVAADVLEEKTFSNDAGVSVTGTMVDNGAVILIPSVSNQSIATGYHNGSGYVGGDAGLIPANIRNGVILFGEEGVLRPYPSQAALDEILVGCEFWCEGYSIEGQLPCKKGCQQFHGTM